MNLKDREYRVRTFLVTWSHFFLSSNVGDVGTFMHFLIRTFALNEVISHLIQPFARFSHTLYGHRTLYGPRTLYGHSTRFGPV